MQDPEPLAEATKWFNLRVAEELRRAMSATGAKQADVAEVLGVKPKQVSYKLNAHSGFSIEDLVALAIRFGVQVIPSVGHRDELFPPQLRSRLSWRDSAAGSEVSLRRPTVLADVDMYGFARRLAERLANDGSIPRRLLIDADLRRHAIGALSDLGFSESRLFRSENGRSDLHVGPSAGVLCFLVASSTISVAEDVEMEYTRLVSALSMLADMPVISKFLIALLSRELEVAVDEAIGSTEDGVVELPSPAGVVIVRALATERSGNDTVVVFGADLVESTAGHRISGSEA